MTKAPGWYDDGSMSGTERWFDGMQWTQQVRPSAAWAAPMRPQDAGGRPGPQPFAGAQPAAPFSPYGQTQPYPGPGPVPVPQWPTQPPAPAGSDPSDPVHWLVPVGRSWQSIAAGYVALFGLVIWVLAPVALWLGIWAMRRAKYGGHGRGRAVFAIIAGTLGTLAMVAFVVAQAT